MSLRPRRRPCLRPRPSSDPEERARASGALAIVALAALALSACTIQSEPPLSERDGGADASTDAAAIDAGPRDAGFSCRPGVVGCFGDTHYTCGDDGLSREDEVECPDACDPERGCVPCVPNSRRCEGSVSMVCDAEGSGWSFGRDCEDWGVACGEGGFCEDDCASAEALRSYIGCEYFASPLANYQGDTSFDPETFDFRVVVTNPNTEPVEVTIKQGRQLMARERIVPGGVAEIPLPWVQGLSFPFDGSPWQSLVRADGAYRILADRPVIAAQFNPFQYASGREHSYTNDASLLLPVHALGTEHVALSYPPLTAGISATEGDRFPGYVALIGVTPEPARVEITPSVDVAEDAEGRWPATPAGAPLAFMLARGEVALVTPAVPPICTQERPVFSPVIPGEPDRGGYCYEAEHDLTGSRIVSDRPIAAFGGHACAFVPFDVAACDHLETMLAPVATWGSAFETMPLRDPETDVPNLVRIIAAYDGTELTLDPPQRGVDPRAVLDRGEHVDFMLEGPVSIASSEPVQVGQLLLGQNYRNPPLPRGDPGMTILVPAEQFRREYVFVTPSSYVATVNGQSWVLVSREPGVAISLDGAPVEADWIAVGDRELARVPVDGGAHHAESSSPFGLVAYGLGSYTSYAYPAGLDLRVIPF